jgi:hypothetical protein
MKDFNVANYKKGEILVHMLLELTFLDWKSKVDKMNAAIESSKAKCKWFSCEEFLVGLGLIVGAAEFSPKGVGLFGGKYDEEEDDNYIELWPSISPNPQFEQFMAFSHFKAFRRFLPSIYANESLKGKDLWWEFAGAVDKFNLIRHTKLTCSEWISVDETMCAWRPWHTALGGLPNISFIVRKPKPLGKLKNLLLYF